MQTSPHMEQKKDQPHLPKVAVSRTRAKCVSQSPSCLQDLCIYPHILPSEDFARVPELSVMQPQCIHKHVHARQPSTKLPVMGKQLWEVTKSAEMTLRSDILVLFWSDSDEHQIKIKPRNISRLSKVADWALPSGVSCFCSVELVIKHVLSCSDCHIWSVGLGYWSQSKFQDKHLVKQSRWGSPGEQNVLFVRPVSNVSSQTSSLLEYMSIVCVSHLLTHV